MQGYNKFRELCALSKIDSMTSSKPPSFIFKKRWALLRKLYATPNEIDLYIGGIMEKTRKGMPGPTFTCINRKQFVSALEGKYSKYSQRVKVFILCNRFISSGDRFFFTHSGSTAKYNFQQIQQLNRRRLRDIVCENTMIPRAQMNLFQTKGIPKPCSKYNYLDVSLFL